MDFICKTCIQYGTDGRCHKERIVAPSGKDFTLVFPKVPEDSRCHLGEWSVIFPKCNFMYDGETSKVSDFTFVVKLVNAADVKGHAFWDDFCENSRCYFCEGSCLPSDYLVEIHTEKKDYLSHYFCLSKNASNIQELTAFIDSYKTKPEASS